MKHESPRRSIQVADIDGGVIVIENNVKVRNEKFLKIKGEMRCKDEKQNIRFMSQPMEY